MKQQILSKQAPAPIGPFSQAIKATGTILYVSGHIGMENNVIVEGGIQAQTKKALENIREILKEAGYTFEDVVKVNVYLSNMDDFGSMNETYSSFFKSPEPARTTIEVSRLPKDAMVEIELTAII